MPEASRFEDRIARLRLIRSSTIGPVTYRQLLARFGSAEAAIGSVPVLAAQSGGRAPAMASRAAAEREMEEVSRQGARHLFEGDQDYPALLTQLDSAPPVLIVKGRLELLNRTAVALVGARNASAGACRFARELARDLGAEDVVVISGLARGIDAAAHDGSLATGTIAVVAGGIDVVYPPEHEDRQRVIGEEGLLVAEQPPGLVPRARHFPYRNRIIAGLAQGTVVIEAAPRSGSLITARHAAEFGRDVMAVPGSPIDPRSQGCNQLIREGAILVQSASDVLEALRPFDVRPVAEAARIPPPVAQQEVDGQDRSHLIGLLSPTPVAVDELLRQSGLAPAIVHAVLLELELAGQLERHAGGRVSRT